MIRIQWEDIQSLISILKKLDDEEAAIVLSVIITLLENRSKE